MTWEKFWSIIDRVRAKADMQDEASVKQFLYTELIKLPQDELLGFDCAWQSYRNKANFPKMVAAACIINDGSSDDRFTDFRNWLIMQGYDAYRQALIDPDNLAALNIPFRDTEWMGCGNVAWYAYAGQKLRAYFEKAGIAAELHRKYPTLLKLPDDLHQAIMQEQLAPCRAPETEWERQMLRTEVNQSKGRSGSYSINHQQSGRDLMTPDEVRLLDNSKCILFIRGERPVIDLKYNLLKHPNIRYTEDGGAAPYDYTAADNALDDLPCAPENYELLDMDDFLPTEPAEIKPTIQRIRRPK